MSDIIEQIHKAIEGFYAAHQERPETIYLGLENFNRFDSHPEIWRIRSYSVKREPLLSRYDNMTYDGVRILCVLGDPLHIRAV